jgi:hypothetical protein
VVLSQLNPIWIPYTGGTFPSNAVPGQLQDGKVWPVCRAPWPGTPQWPANPDMVIPGKAYAQLCNVAYGGDGTEAQPSSGRMDILTCNGDCAFNILEPNARSFWVPGPFVGRFAVLAGTDNPTSNPKPEYVCTTQDSFVKGWQSGKLIDGVCYYEYGGKEYSSREYLWLRTFIATPLPHDPGNAPLPPPKPTPVPPRPEYQCFWVPLKPGWIFTNHLPDRVTCPRSNRV